MHHYGPLSLSSNESCSLLLPSIEQATYDDGVHHYGIVSTAVVLQLLQMVCPPGAAGS